ncbi:hypothetical protein AOLI_G00054290 [Acnodon oligacanthus]
MERRTEAAAKEEEEEEEGGPGDRVDGEVPRQRLSCCPERYTAAKFSLAAYVLCWTLLALLQRLRRGGAGRQSHCCTTNEKRGTGSRPHDPGLNPSARLPSLSPRWPSAVFQRRDSSLPT